MSRRIDRPALGLAVLLEALLTWLAAFGGPHGTLGGVPWLLQLPGILLVLFVPGSAGFVWRVAGMVIVQVLLWYLLISAVRRRRRTRASPDSPTGS